MVEKLGEIRNEYLEYNIDGLFEQHGHTILRLPPYHPTLNPIEEVWGVLKRRVAAENVSQSDRDVFELINKHFGDLNETLWQNCCEKVKSAEINFMANDLSIQRDEEIGESVNQVDETDGIVSESESAGAGENLSVETEDTGSESRSSDEYTSSCDEISDEAATTNSQSSSTTDSAEEGEAMDFEIEIPSITICKSFQSDC